jgi:GAF domain-containing protein
LGLKQGIHTADLASVQGHDMLERVLRTQAATARPGFDVDEVLGTLVAEAQSLTGSAGAAIVVRGRGRIATAGRCDGPSVEVLLPPTAPAGGALVVYGRQLTGDDRQVLELLAGLVGSTLTRAALDAESRPAVRHL